MGAEENIYSIWQARAIRAGFVWFQNKRLIDMSDEEIEEAFHQFGKKYGYHYIWY